MYLVDPYEKYGEYEGEKNNTARLDKAQAQAHVQLESYGGVEHLRKRSTDAAELITESLDYVYIDGNHEYEFVKQDIAIYYDLLKPGGIIAGHDFNGYYPGVIRAVVEFAQETGIEMRTTKFGDDWYIIKPEIEG